MNSDDMAFDWIHGSVTNQFCGSQSAAIYDQVMVMQILQSIGRCLGCRERIKWFLVAHEHCKDLQKVLCRESHSRLTENILAGSLKSCNCAY